MSELGKRNLHIRGVPVFIITCVVARLTFFLNPDHHVRLRGFASQRGYAPAHDILKTALSLARSNVNFRSYAFLMSVINGSGGR